MDKALVVAGVSGTFSVLVALLSAATAISASRRAARSAQELERMKLALHRTLATDTFRDEHLNAELEALRVSIEAIQVFKDEVQVLLSAPQRVAAATALALIASRRVQVFAVYERVAGILDDRETRILHQAKNLALAIESLLADALQEKTFSSELSDEYRTQLLSVRVELSDRQELLRDSRVSRLLTRTQGAR